MSNGKHPYPRIEVLAQPSPLLMRSRSDRPWSLYALTAVRLVSEAGRRSPLLPVRFDSGAFVSLLPEEWLQGLQDFLVLENDPQSFTTAAGSGEGRLAPGVPTVFSEAPDDAYSFDWLVTAGLNGRGYGLLSLRDVLTYFA